TKGDTLESNETGSVTMETQGDVVTLFLSNTNANTNESSTELQTIQTNTAHKRTRKRKLFFDEEDEMIHDKEMRVSYGADVIKTAESLKPLPPKLRRHLVKIMCQHLIRKTHSAMPSTDQRDQLAGCIVIQLYSTFTGKEYKQLKDGTFAAENVGSSMTEKTVATPENVTQQSYILSPWDFKIVKRRHRVVNKTLKKLELKKELSATFRGKDLYSLFFRNGDNYRREEVGYMRNTM
ncbi:unnamed protein product, partial [Allacma fusca]